MTQLGMPFLLETPTVEDCCRQARTLGLDFVELNGSFPNCALEELDPGSLRTLAKRYGLFFTLHADEECNPFAFNEEVRQAWMRSLKKTLLLAVDTGMPTVNMHMARGVYITLPERRVFMYDRYSDRHMAHVMEVQTLAERILSGTCTRLCIENTEGFMPHEQAALEALLKSPCIGLTLDIGHDHAAQNRDLSFYEAHHAKLWHMHGHDAIGTHPHLALDEGEMDWRTRFAMAQRCNARIVLEVKTLDALRRSVPLARAALASAKEERS